MREEAENVDVIELEQSWGSLENRLRQSMALPKEPRCEWSDLFVSHCAHCLGHVPFWDEQADEFQVSKVIYG